MVISLASASPKPLQRAPLSLSAQRTTIGSAAYACPTPPSGPTSKGVAPLPQKETEKKRFPENVISTDKSVLLWMYCREIAPFDTPTFSEKVGELIARATSTPTARL